jgi:hypothetical protein
MYIASLGYEVAEISASLSNEYYKANYVSALEEIRWAILYRPMGRMLKPYSEIGISIYRKTLYW